ncbi:hypothetical protein U9M48_005693 [Paspalum notatum var. saurae]|uniref:Uncharacterized protein n=1 Tax=Paspalum notatum var. saurae TaxID=547442 RepID=A0AAQ3PSS2_PASNO
MSEPGVKFFHRPEGSRQEPGVSFRTDGWLRKPALGFNSLMQIPDEIQSSIKAQRRLGRRRGAARLRARGDGGAWQPAQLFFILNGASRKPLS